MKKSELQKLIKEVYQELNELSSKKLDDIQSNVKIGNTLIIKTKKGLLTAKVTDVNIDKHDDVNIKLNGRAKFSDSPLWRLEFEFDDPDWITTLYNIDPSNRFPDQKNATWKDIIDIKLK
jgi:hypothetical protein